MKSRAERNKELEAIKGNVFEAGVSVLKAAKASEDLFDSSIKALAEAMDIDTADTTNEKQLPSIHEVLIAQRQAAELTSDVDAYIAAVEKLEFLADVEVQQLERTARKLEAEVRIKTAKQQLEQFDRVTSTSATDRVEARNVEAVSQFSITAPEQVVHSPSANTQLDNQWTEAKLRAKFKTLRNVAKTLGQEAKSWKEAVKLANQLNLA